MIGFQELLGHSNKECILVLVSSSVAVIPQGVKLKQGYVENFLLGSPAPPPLIDMELSE